MRIAKSAVLIVLWSLCAVPAFAALSPKYQEWREGPVQWLLTPEEEKAWKALESDEEASRFIDLFWARRDPTPNTAPNEYRDEFLNRVATTEAYFGEPRRRGSLTDRGRVYIVLGQPSLAGFQLGGSTMHTLGTAPSGNRNATNRLQGEKDVWSWTREDAAKLDMSTIEIVFIEDPVSKKVQRDPGRADFPRAEAAAIRKSIVNPDLTAVPEWALKGGLDVPNTLSVADAVNNPQVAGELSRLTLLDDIYAITPASKIDPFTKMKPVAVFPAGGSLGWAAQFCAVGDKAPRLRHTIKMTGPAGRKAKEHVADPEEVTPDKLRAAPGCYMLWGLLALDKDMGKGEYQFELQVAGKSVTTPFKIE